MKKKESYKAISFEIKSGSMAGKYQINCPSMTIPGVGVVSAENLAKDSDMLAHLVEINSGVIKKLK